MSKAFVLCSYPPAYGDSQWEVFQLAANRFCRRKGAEVLDNQPSMLYLLMTNENKIELFLMDKKQKYFDSIGDDWDRDLTAEDLERLSHIIDKVDITAGVNVCDLGCGTGVLFDLLRRRVGESGYIVGVDFAPRVAHKAQSNFPFHNIGVVEADASCMPFKDNTFDLVISFAAFAHFSHKDETIRQAQKMLKPGGRIIIIHLHGRTELAKMHHQVGGPIDRDELPNHDELENMFNRGHFSRHELTDTKDLYLAIGFKE